LRVALRSNARDGVSFDIYVVEPASGALPRLLVSGSAGPLHPLDWSPDDAKLLVLREVSINESYLYIADAVTGALTPLGDHRQRVGIEHAEFSADGRGVWVISDRGSEFRKLRFVNLASSEERILTDHLDWDIESFALSADGRYLAYVANADGTSRLTVIDQELKLELSPPNLPAGIITGLRFEPAGPRLAFSLASPRSPRDAYVYDPTRNELTRWTQSETGPVDASKFVEPALIRYPTWDRVDRKPRMIPAFVFRPRTPDPHPVVVDIHGGPESQARPGFDAYTQFLVNELGYAVIFPNVRGSTGYGRTYVDLDNGMQREDAVRDIGSLLVWIGTQRDLDTKRVVVRGGSYGGYMALASLVHFGDRLRGGVNTVGISNFVTFLRSTSGYRRDLRRAEYGDERDPEMREFLERISPLTNAAAIRKPLLIVQGLKDPRVPASESEQMVARIRGGGGEVWYLAAKDEGHGFRKKPNRDVYFTAIASFLERLARE
jgi:dipeptidyl aminopeptidase/acylaminoacyl peptidase